MQSSGGVTNAAAPAPCLWTQVLVICIGFVDGRVVSRALGQRGVPRVLLGWRVERQAKDKVHVEGTIAKGEEQDISPDECG